MQNFTKKIFFFEISTKIIEISKKILKYVKKANYKYKFKNVQKYPKFQKKKSQIFKKISNFYIILNQSLGKKSENSFLNIQNFTNIFFSNLAKN